MGCDHFVEFTDEEELRFAAFADKWNLGIVVEMRTQSLAAELGIHNTIDQEKNLTEDKSCVTEDCGDENQFTARSASGEEGDEVDFLEGEGWEEDLDDFETVERERANLIYRDSTPVSASPPVSANDANRSDDTRICSPRFYPQSHTDIIDHFIDDNSNCNSSSISIVNADNNNGPVDGYVKFISDYFNSGLASTVCTARCTQVCSDYYSRLESLFQCLNSVLLQVHVLGIEMWSSKDTSNKNSNINGIQSVDNNERFIFDSC